MSNDHGSSADLNGTGTVAAPSSASSRTVVDSAEVAPTLSLVTEAKPSIPVEHHQDTAAPDVAVDARSSTLVDQDRQPAATSTLRLVAATTAPPTAPSKTLAPVAPNPGQRLQQSVQQLIGLVSDAGIVGASLVNNIAVQTALAIGPVPFWGLPYAIGTGIAGTAGNISKALSGTPIDAASIGPFAVNYGVLDVLSFCNPTKVPAGANASSIDVTVAHPLPIILVNGTVETQNLDWSVGAPVLANAGYEVYTFNYGNPTPFPGNPIQSITDIRQSAAELSAEVGMVLVKTGASKVILIGHSQGGGIMPAY